MANSTDAAVSWTDGLPDTISDARWRRSLRRSMFSWYAHHARDLPWRNSPDPYRVWISEIMLQQTQVETVKPYFRRFVERFPTTQELAAADEHEVLRLWEGLGYYRRARQLHKAAQQIQDQHAGQFPTTIDDVLDLPGIGRYTAGAILSIAFGQRQPILEGNTIRLYSRLIGYDGDPKGSEGQRRLWNFAEAILPRKNVGDFNQAMMELGATVCKPRAPACDQCPLARLCRTRAHGWQDRIPAPAKKIMYQDVMESAVLVRRRQQVLLRRCGPDERWAGLWDFPRFKNNTTGSGADGVADYLADQVAQLTGVKIELLERLTVIKHVVTRFRITLTCYDASYTSGRPRDKDTCRWVNRRELSEYALSVTGRKLVKWIGTT